MVYAGPRAFSPLSSASVLLSSLAYLLKMLNCIVFLKYFTGSGNQNLPFLCFSHSSFQENLKYKHVALNSEYSCPAPEGLVLCLHDLLVNHIFIFSLEPRTVFNVGNKILVLQLLKEYLSQLY